MAKLEILRRETLNERIMQPLDHQDQRRIANNQSLSSNTSSDHRPPDSLQASLGLINASNQLAHGMLAQGAASQQKEVTTGTQTARTNGHSAVAASKSKTPRKRRRRKDSDGDGKPGGKKKGKRAKKPVDMPKRPLSAYNIFFKEKRAKLLEGDTTDPDIPDDIPQGKIGFEMLAKTIGKMWKSLKSDRLERYKTLAEGDMVRYKREMDIYHKYLCQKRKAEEEDAASDDSSEQQGSLPSRMSAASSGVPSEVQIKPTPTSPEPAVKMTANDPSMAAMSYLNPAAAQNNMVGGAFLRLEEERRRSMASPDLNLSGGGGGHGLHTGSATNAASLLRQEPSTGQAQSDGGGGDLLYQRIYVNLLQRAQALGPADPAVLLAIASAQRRLETRGSIDGVVMLEVASALSRMANRGRSTQQPSFTQQQLADTAELLMGQQFSRSRLGL